MYAITKSNKRSNIQVSHKMNAEKSTEYIKKDEHSHIKQFTQIKMDSSKKNIACREKAKASTINIAVLKKKENIHKVSKNRTNEIYIN